MENTHHSDIVRYDHQRMDTLTTWIGQHDVALAIVFLTFVVMLALGTISDAIKHVFSETRIDEIVQHVATVQENLQSIESELLEIRRALSRSQLEGDDDPVLYGVSVVEVLKQIRDRMGKA